MSVIFRNRHTSTISQGFLKIKRPDNYVKFDILGFAGEVGGFISMRLLIDTHIFLWLAQGTNQLTPQLLSILTDSRNQLFLSTVSLWEMQIKHTIGKLELPLSVQNFFLIHRYLLNLQSISVREQHIWALGTLPYHHRDPFDRMLIAQATIDKLTLVSVDAIFQQYDVTLLGPSLTSRS